jgi:hypothetical protein
VTPAAFYRAAAAAARARRRPVLTDRPAALVLELAELDHQLRCGCGDPVCPDPDPVE